MKYTVYFSGAASADQPRTLEIEADYIEQEASGDVSFFLRTEAGQPNTRVAFINDSCLMAVVSSKESQPSA